MGVDLCRCVCSDWTHLDTGPGGGDTVLEAGLRVPGPAAAGQGEGTLALPRCPLEFCTMYLCYLCKNKL